MASRVRNAHFYTNRARSTRGNKGETICCMQASSKASGKACGGTGYPGWPGRVPDRCERRSSAGVLLEFVEVAPELLLFLQQLRELDAQVRGLGLHLGEAQ